MRICWKLFSKFDHILHSRISSVGSCVIHINALKLNVKGTDVMSVKANDPWSNNLNFWFNFNWVISTDLWRFDLLLDGMSMSIDVPNFILGFYNGLFLYFIWLLSLIVDSSLHLFLQCHQFRYKFIWGLSHRPVLIYAVDMRDVAHRE